MLIDHDAKSALYDFSKKIGLATNNAVKQDKAKKIEQIVAYLEVIHSQVRQYSPKRQITFIDSGAGNCYLSFIAYYFYSQIIKRPIKIHCVDINIQLMDKNREVAKKLGFSCMQFYAEDIENFEYKGGSVELVYSLHACDTATDKTMYLGIRTNAKHILSVSCCQHTIKKQFKSNDAISAITRHPVYKDKLTYMIGDSLRSLLLEMQGYKVDVIEFVSARSTDKNILVRAKKRQINSISNLRAKYECLQTTFGITPHLENYLLEGNYVTPSDEVVLFSAANVA